MRKIKTLAVVLLIALLAITDFHFSKPNVQAQSVDSLTPFSSIKLNACNSDEIFAIAVHGGAVFRPGNYDNELNTAKSILGAARQALAWGATAIDVVEAAIAAMENSGVFNAGKGAIANQDGVVEMDASIMEGRRHQAGAVASVESTRNPISAARMVMDKTRHVMLVGPDADEFVTDNGGEIVETSYFVHGGNNFSDVPLPTDLEILPLSDNLEIIINDEDVTVDIAKFLGAWAGTWPDISLNHVLVVEEINHDNAKVIYGLGPDPTITGGNGKYLRLVADYVDGGLRVVEPADLGGYTVHYRLKPDGTLKVTGTKTDTSEFYQTTLKRLAQPSDDHDGGTVGAVVRDRCGDLAAGTSTGGYDAKIPGRVGDSPIIGAGTYADNDTAAISATGHGELFIRHVVAHEITAAMKYKGISLKEAATNLIEDELIVKKVRGGVIAVDRQGNFAMPYNTQGMVRGTASHLKKAQVAVF